VAFITICYFVFLRAANRGITMGDRENVEGQGEAGL
jgi:hypothetical protein